MNKMYKRETKPLLSSDESDSNDWSFDSEENSKYSGSESSDPEWQNNLLPNGELMYIKYKEGLERIGDMTEELDLMKLRNNFKRLSTRRVSRGKFFKSRAKKDQNRTEHTERDHNFKSTPTTQLDEIVINILLSKPFQCQNRCKVEELFGIKVTDELIVESIKTKARHLYNKDIKSYILIEIDKQLVTPTNIDAVLKKIKIDNKFHRLRFKKIDKAWDLNVKYLISSEKEHETALTNIIREANFSVMYIPGDESDADENHANDFYCFPTPEKNNFLYKIRGVFITLNHLVPKLLSGNSPKHTSILIDNNLHNVFYLQEEEDLYLMSFPERTMNIICGEHLTNMFVRLLRLRYGSLKLCFNNKGNFDKVNELFMRFFLILSSGCYGHERLPGSGQVLFEQFLSSAHTISLPREVKLQIDDSLYELEAADYREWSDDPLNDQRVYVVTGSCLFYAGHLLTSHMTDEDLKDVHSFLVLKGLLSLSMEHHLEKLVVWEEVIVHCHRNRYSGDQKYRIPDGKWFLLIVGKGKFLLATLMEAGGCSEEAEDNSPPAPFYVEECECCLEILFEVELDKFLEGWSLINASPQIQLKPESLSGKNSKLDSCELDSIDKTLASKLTKDNQESKRRHHSIEQINTQIEFYGPSSSQDISNVKRTTLNNQLSQSTTNFNTNSPKQRSTYNNNNSGRWYSNRKSFSVGNNLDMDFSEGTNSPRSNSEIYDDMSKKSNRTRIRHDSSSSESDWDIQEGSRTSGKMDFSDMKRTIMSEISEITAKRITCGERNVLFHFVQLDFQKGVFLAPVKTLELSCYRHQILYKYILDTFRETSRNIHDILQDAVKFKEAMKTPPASPVNKSFVAVKEHGVLHEVPTSIINKIHSSERPQQPFKFWIVGCLLAEPDHRELYLCYHDSVPQEALEVAYRLSYLE